MHRAVVLGALVSGCSLVSLDGLSDGEVAPPAPDGGTTTDGGGDDAGVDGGSPDGALLNASPCNPVPTPAPFLCVDFDDGTPLSQHFPVADISPSASARIDQGDAVSAPGSLLITLPSGAGQGASFVKAMPAAATTISMDVDVRLIERGEGSDNDFISFYLDDANEVDLEVRAATGAVVLDVDVEGTATKTPLPLQLGDRWTHIRWDVVIDGESATTTISADGVVLTTAVTGSVAFRSSFILGDRALSTITGAWRMRFDNLVIHAR